MTFKEFMEGKLTESVSSGFTAGPSSKKKYFHIDRRVRANTTTFLLRDEVGKTRYVAPKDLINL